MSCAADLVLRGGRVYTVDPDFSGASAVAVSGDSITAVGGPEIDQLIGPTTHVIDLDGRSVLPGINDAHLHLAFFGQWRPPFADLTTARSLTDLKAALAQAAAGLDSRQWLIGQGWSEARIAEYSLGTTVPHRSHIDEVTGDRPAALTHASAHGILANTAALRIARPSRRCGSR